MLEMHVCSLDTLGMSLPELTFEPASAASITPARSPPRICMLHATWIDTSALEARSRCLKRLRLYLFFLCDDRYAAVPDLIVNRVDARGLDLDQNLTSGSGRQRMIVDELQDFRRSECFVDHCLHNSLSASAVTVAMSVLADRTKSQSQA